MAKHYKPDHRSLRGFLLSEQLNKPVRQISREIMAAAKARTPRQSAASRERRGDTSTPMADSFKMAVTTAVGPAPGRRWSGGRRRIVEITNDAEGVVAQEFGNGRVEGHHMLRDAGAPYHTPIVSDGGFE